MLQYLSNAFNDPSNPWYYVIGLLFLLAIFGALTVYVIFSGKKKKGDEEQNKDEQPNNTDAAQANEQAGESEVVSSADSVIDPQDPSDK